MGAHQEEFGQVRGTGRLVNIIFAIEFYVVCIKNLSLSMTFVRPSGKVCQAK